MDAKTNSGLPCPESAKLGAALRRWWALASASSAQPAAPFNDLLFGFGGLSEYSGLGMVLGVIIAGVLMRPEFERMGPVGDQIMHTIQSVSYGMLGLVFFFWVGLSVYLLGILESPGLSIGLYLAGTLGKLLGVF